MAKLSPPAELLDQPAGVETTFHVLRWEDGEMEITARGAPAARTVRAIRMHVPPEDKPIGAPYWDATAGNLVARLLPMLDMVVRDHREIRIVKHGIAPFARHQVDLL